MEKDRKISQQDIIWDRYVKQRIRQTSSVRVHRRIVVGETWKIFTMQRFTMQYEPPPPATENIAIAIRRIKAKILRLDSKYMRGVLMDTVEHDNIQGEDITTYHYISSCKRQKTSLVTHVLDAQGQIQVEQDDMMRLFTNFLETKYSHQQMDKRSFQKLVSYGMPKIPEDSNTELDHPITMEEMRETVKKGKRHKSPGPEGICHEFSKQMWDVFKNDMLDVINNMHMEGVVSDAQKHGHIVCLPNKSRPC